MSVLTRLITQTHTHLYTHTFLLLLQVTVVLLVIQLMLRCTFLVPLLDTQFCTIASQCINSLEAPEEPVKIVENGLEHRHLVLVSYIYVAGNLTVQRGNAIAIQGIAGQEPYKDFFDLPVAYIGTVDFWV